MAHEGIVTGVQGTVASVVVVVVVVVDIVICDDNNDYDEYK